MCVCVYVLRARYAFVCLFVYAVCERVCICVSFMFCLHFVCRVYLCVLVNYVHTRVVVFVCFVYARLFVYIVIFWYRYMVSHFHSRVHHI